MTPQERELVTALFDRLATLENQPRDPDAERTIIDGLRQAPHATYALVQTALVQDEALRRADARIQELEAQFGDEPPTQPTGFLDGMRDALLGRREPPRGGSVPSVRPGQYQGQEPAPMVAGPREEAALAPGAASRQAPAPGGSFLGTAASTAAGVIGGSLLLDSIRSMMGHGHGAFGIADPASAAGREHGSPWDNSGGGDLARQAGADDIGRDQHQGGGGGSGLLDDGAADHGTDAPPDQDVQDVQDAGDFDDDGGDFGGGDFGGDDSSDV
jgi:hypothetical protein